MSKSGRLSPIASRVTASTVGLNGISNAPQRTWRRLLSPQYVETGVFVIDFIIIVTSGILSSFVYHRITAHTSGNLAPYAGMGLIVAANFAAIMMARRNYSLKRLTLFVPQIRETVIVWTCTCGLLAIV